MIAKLKDRLRAVRDEVKADAATAASQRQRVYNCVAFNAILLTVFGLLFANYDWDRGAITNDLSPSSTKILPSTVAAQLSGQTEQPAPAPAALPGTCTGGSQTGEGAGAACAEAPEAVAGEAMYRQYEEHVIRHYWAVRKWREVPAAHLAALPLPTADQADFSAGIAHSLSCPVPGTQCSVQMRGGPDCELLLDALFAGVAGPKLKIFLVGDSTVRSMFVLYKMCADGDNKMSAKGITKRMFQAKFEDHMNELKADFQVTRGSGQQQRTVEFIYMKMWGVPAMIQYTLADVATHNAEANEASVPTVVYLNIGLHVLWLDVGYRRNLMDRTCGIASMFRQMGQYVQKGLAHPSFASAKVTIVYGHTHDICPRKLKGAGENGEAVPGKRLSRVIKKVCAGKNKNNNCPECKRMTFNQVGSEFLYGAVMEGTEGSGVKVVDVYNLTKAAGCHHSEDGIHYSPDVEWLKCFLFAQRVRLSGGP